MDDIYKNIAEYNTDKKKLKTLIEFDDLITDILSNEKHNPIVIELYIRGRKLNENFNKLNLIIHQIFF